MSGKLRQIKRRLKSTSNIGKLTRAMQLVAASKIRQVQKKALASRPYSEKVYEIINNLMASTNPRLHPLLKKPKSDPRPLIILISTNKGLCGSLNTVLFRYLNRFLNQKNKQQPAIFDYITLGSKGVDYVLTLGGGFMADFSDLTPFSLTAPALVQLITTQFIEDKNTSVWLVYNAFVNILKQTPTFRQILPFTDLSVPTVKSKSDLKIEYKVEPSYNKLVNDLLPYYLANQIREAFLQSEAAEHAARMMAMKNATDNAYGLMLGLKQQYNQARQQSVTSEIADIVTAKLNIEKI